MITSPPPPLDPQQVRDEEHLKLLSIFHYVVGGIHCAFAALFVFQMLFMLAMVSMPAFFGKPGEALPPMFIGIFMAVFWGIFILFALAPGIGVILSGRAGETMHLAR